MNILFLDGIILVLNYSLLRQIKIIDGINIITSLNTKLSRIDYGKQLESLKLTIG